MITKPLTDLFEGGGMLITPSSNKKIIDLNYSEIVTLFERFGVLLFRGFELEPHEVSDVTNIYSQSYSNDAIRRSSRFDQKIVRNVDLGNDAHTLHSESSYSISAWPEILWFYCNIAPNKNGATTLCDGKKLWENLSLATKAFFLAEPLSFDIEIPFVKPRKDRGKQVWISNKTGTRGFINWQTGSFDFTQLVYAVHESRSGKELCFANHLLAELGKDPQIKNKFMKTMNGKKVPVQYINEVKQESNKITFDLHWQDHDLIMIDNKRFMHGRRAFEKNCIREILVVQTSRASFGFGATTRNRIEDS